MILKRAAAAVTLGALVASAFSTGAAAVPARSGATAAKTITVTAGEPMELRFRLSSKKAPKGLVIFRVANAGTIDHDFKIKGRKTRMLSSGERATLRVTFNRTGTFQFICTVPGHAQAGMKGTFRIT
jgi:uncharacterized cupredoxin-like copper-binding protein